MNTKSIVAAALVLGSSSLALAQPAPQGGVTVDGSADFRDHRAPESYRPLPVFRPMLKMLADDTRISRFGRDTLTFARPLRLRTIKLQGETGRTSISEVAIKFANGRQQIIEENKLLTKDGCIDIDLAGNVRTVTSIVIYGRSNSRASFDVLGA